MEEKKIRVLRISSIKDLEDKLEQIFRGSDKYKKMLNLDRDKLGDQVLLCAKKMGLR